MKEKKKEEVEQDQQEEVAATSLWAQLVDVTPRSAAHSHSHVDAAVNTTMTLYEGVRENQREGALILGGLHSVLSHHPSTGAVFKAAAGVGAGAGG